jgi:hypothetical protein
MLLRAMRGPAGTRRPSLVARALALLVVAGMLAITAPQLARPTGALLRWLAGLL